MRLRVDGPSGHSSSHADPKPKPNTSIRKRRGHGQTAARILEILSASRRALGAYDVLKRLREHGRYDPPTVYRALNWLIDQRRVYRLQTLRAYVARRLEPDVEAGAAVQGSSLLIICDRCRCVHEMADARLGRQINRRATAAMFEPRTTVIEVLGTCEQCRKTKSTRRDRSAAACQGSEPSGAMQ